MSTSSVVNRYASRLGIQIRRVPRPRVPVPTLLDSNETVTDVGELQAKASQVPGMLSDESGAFLYLLCVMQAERGDVVEVGSWQGRSTAYLASAVRDSANGSLFAIDHFKGNVGRETSYKVGSHDLSDLRRGFIDNMAKFDLSEFVRLLDCSTEEAAPAIADRQIRMLFIDGDHSYDGVRRDFELFQNQLVPGAVVVFDDVDQTFPGIVRLVGELLSGSDFDRAFSYPNTVVLKKRA